MTPIRSLTLVAATAVAHAASAQVHGSDIILTVQDGRIVTGALATGQPDPYFPEHVFGSEFDPVTFFTDEPGYDSPEGTFPPFSQVGFTIRRALRVWDGSGFDHVPTERIQIRLGSLGPVLTPPDDQPVVGFAMTVNALGELHAHPGYTLLDPARQGIYLLELELWHNTPSSSLSRPFWIVFNNDEDEPVHEAAIRHVYLTRVCPADRNLDRTVDFNDLLEYLNEFNAELPDADLNGDGVIDFNDFLVYLNYFNGPCPIL
jgi:hypothetical protein